MDFNINKEGNSSVAIGPIASKKVKMWNTEVETWLKPSLGKRYNQRLEFIQQEYEVLLLIEDGPHIPL